MLTNQLPASNENAVDDDAPRRRERSRPTTSRVRAGRTDGGTSTSFDEMLRAIVRTVVREELARNKPAPADDAHLSTRAAAKHAGVATGTIRRWIRDGKLREFRAGRHLRVRRADVDALLAGEREGPEASPEDLARQAYGA